MSSHSLSLDSTQDDEEECNQDVSSASNFNGSLEEGAARTSGRRWESTRRNTRFQAAAGSAVPGTPSGRMSSTFPPPLMGLGPRPPNVAGFSTTNRNANNASRRSRQNRPGRARDGFAGARRAYNPSSDFKSETESLMSAGGPFETTASPFCFTPGDDHSRMKPLSRTSPFLDDRGNHGPRCSQPNDKGEVTYPLVFLSPGGSISIILHQNLIIETSVDRSVRVVNYGLYSAYMDHSGTASSIIHSHARIVHKGESVSGRFDSTNDKMVIFGTPGVLFSMENLREAYLINASSKSPTALGIDRLQFPKMAEDCTLMQFYRESQTGVQYIPNCREIVDEATYDRKSDGTLVMHINGMTIRYWKSGDLHIDARPRHIKCTADGSVHVRTTFIDINVQSSDMAFIKFGSKRVHISRSGMVISDGPACTSMDQFGRIIAST